MAKSEYWLLPVRYSINKIMKVAKEYNIELIKEKGFAFWEYRGHRFAVNNDNHPFIAYLQNLNDEVVLTKRFCTDLVPFIDKLGFYLSEDDMKQTLLYPSPSELGLYAKEFIYDVVNIVSLKIEAIEKSTTPPNIAPHEYNDVSFIMKRLPLLKLSDNHIIALQDVGSCYSGRTNLFIACKEGFAENYPDQKVPSDVTMLISKGLNVDFNSYELHTKVENLNVHLKLFPQDARRIKNMWQFIEVPFTPDGLWQAFLLDEMWRWLPLYWHANYAKVTYILDLDDLRYHTRRDSSLSKRTDLLPHVTINTEDCTAIIHYTYWSEWQGLVTTKLHISQENGVLKWGHREEEVLIPYNCGILF